MQKDKKISTKFYKKALDLYIMSARQGEGDSAYQAGQLYLSSYKIKKDLNQFMRWHKIAVKNGFRGKRYIAKPFNFYIGHVKLAAIDKDNLDFLGYNAYTNYKAYKVININDYNYRGLKGIMLHFDENNVLQVMFVKFSKDVSFMKLYWNMQKKYVSLDDKSPYLIRNSYTKFYAENAMIEMAQRERGKDILMVIKTHELYDAWPKLLEKYNRQKKQHEQNML